MTQLILIGGPIGVGKTTVMKHLQAECTNADFLDADDVWRLTTDLMADVNNTERQLAHANVLAVLAGYFEAGCESVFLSWVFARAELYEPVFAGMANIVDHIRLIHLTATEAVLAERLKQRQQELKGSYDVKAALEYSRSRLALIEPLGFPKIDTSLLAPAAVAEEIIRLLAED